MFKWVKLFEIDGIQVLFYLEPDGDDMILHQVTYADDISVDMALRFGNDMSDTSRKAFDMIDEDAARNLLEIRRKMFAEAAAAAAAEDGTDGPLTVDTDDED